jgi:hypothetical protein
MTLYDTVPHLSKVHKSWVANDGKHVMVPNLNEVNSTTPLVTKANVRVLEPQGVDEKLDPHCGEA